MPQVTIQIGKNGLTKGTIDSLETTFKVHEIVRICVLKSAGHTKEKVSEMADKIVNDLGRNYTYRIVGFTIFIRKWKKPKR